ncbi:MAG: hypothetical protein Q7R47_03525, partial [Candidatus Diapherotrites archaeon]|nr:hypothetical protein [Candidatus Diapherotrites archaeon]
MTKNEFMLWFTLDKDTKTKDLKTEQILRKFIFKNADIVRFKRKEWGFIHRKGTANDPLLAQSLENLKKDFLRKEPKSNASKEQYFYRLSAQMKQRFDQTTLLYDSEPF